MGDSNGLVCIDSHVVVWGIKKQSANGQEPMIPKTINFLEYLDDQNIEILLPSPCMVEVLSVVPPEKYPRFFALINKRFRIGSLDTIASQKCAEMIYDKYQNDPEFIEARKSNIYPRRKMKYDFLISAISIVNNAKCIYSNDSDIRKFASNYIDVREIPNINKQIGFDFK